MGVIYPQPGTEQNLIPAWPTLPLQPLIFNEFCSTIPSCPKEAGQGRERDTGIRRGPVRSVPGAGGRAQPRPQPQPQPMPGQQHRPHRSHSQTALEDEADRSLTQGEPSLLSRPRVGSVRPSAGVPFPTGTWATGWGGCWPRQCGSHARAVGAAGGRRAGPPGDLRLRVSGQRLRLGGRCRVRRGGLPAGHGPGAAARPRGRAAVRRAAGRGAGRAGPGPAGRRAPLAAPDAGPAAGAGADRAAAPGVQRALRAARGPPGPVRGARQGLPRRGAHRRRPRRGAHLPAHPGAAAGLPPLAQDPGPLRLGAGLRAAEAEHGLQGDEEEAVQLRAAAHRGVLTGRAGPGRRSHFPSALEGAGRARRLLAAAVV